MNEPGHNSGAIAGDRLKSLIERIENLEEDKSNIADDIRNVYAEGKTANFDVKTMREIVKMRRVSTNERHERDQLRVLYMSALGMLGDTPLGEAALAREEHETNAPAAT